MPKTIPRPKGHHTITPSFAVNHAAKVIEFLEKAFDAKVTEKYEGPGGAIMHAEVHIGDSAIMLGEPMPDAGHEAMPAQLSYHVVDGAAVDAVYRRALAAGARSLAEPKDQFYGWRSATVRDVGGNKWTICSIVEEVPEKEIQRRMQEMMKG